MLQLRQLLSGKLAMAQSACTCLLLLLLAAGVHGQQVEDADEDDYFQPPQREYAREHRWPIGLLPGHAARYHGLIIDMGSATGSLDEKPLPQALNGLSIGLNPFQLALVAMGLPYLVLAPLEVLKAEPALTSTLKSSAPESGPGIHGLALYPFGISTYEGARIKGLLFSTIMYDAGSVEGLAVAGLLGASVQSRGLSVAGLVNASGKHKGLQVGLVNYATELSGLQIGLLNRVGNRVIPLINVGFGAKERRKGGQELQTVP